MRIAYNVDNNVQYMDHDYIYQIAFIYNLLLL